MSVLKLSLSVFISPPTPSSPCCALHSLLVLGEDPPDAPTPGLLFNTAALKFYFLGMYLIVCKSVRTL